MFWEERANIVWETVHIILPSWRATVKGSILKALVLPAVIIHLTYVYICVYYVRERTWNAYGGLARNVRGETGGKRTSMKACRGAAKTFSLHPDDAESVEGGLTEARIPGSPVCGSSYAHSTKWGASVCACFWCVKDPGSVIYVLVP